MVIAFGNKHRYSRVKASDSTDRPAIREAIRMADLVEWQPVAVTRHEAMSDIERSQAFAEPVVKGVNGVSQTTASDTRGVVQHLTESIAGEELHTASGVT